MENTIIKTIKEAIDGQLEGSIYDFYNSIAEYTRENLKLTDEFDEGILSLIPEVLKERLIRDDKHEVDRKNRIIKLAIIDKRCAEVEKMKE
jgi:hypothetical protein